MNTSLNALEMLVMIWITIYSSNHHRHLYAREKSSKDEHVTALPLSSSQSGENVVTNTYTDNDQVMVLWKNDLLLGYVWEARRLQRALKNEITACSDRGSEHAVSWREACAKWLA